MAAKNAKKRAKFRPPELAREPDVTTPDAYVPDCGRACETCGESPVVTGMREGRVVLDTDMCGVCTWGKPTCVDPANW